MRLLWVILVVTAVCGASTPAPAQQRSVWFERVLAAAPYLPGRWHVEGTRGHDRWQGEWSCQLVPGQWTYWITCTAAPQHEDEQPQTISLLSGPDRRNGRPITARIPSSGARSEQRVAGDQLVGKPRVRREGDDHFVWESATAAGPPLTLTFRRIHETARPILPAAPTPEEVPARPL